MALSRIVSLAGTCLLALQGSHAENKQANATATETPADCLNAMNDARNAAGLQPFTQGTLEVAALSATADTGEGKFWRDICVMMQEKSGGYHEKATFFYAPQTGTAADCPAAVAYWQKGLAQLSDSLPPPYTNSTDIYKDPAFLGLVGLYNPQAKATVDCKFVVCPSSPTDTEGTEQAPASFLLREAGSVAKAVSGLPVASSLPNSVANLPVSGVDTYQAVVCVTTPPALVDNEPPFEQDQWNQIAGSISGSSTATLSTFFILALTALTIGII